ncbi:connectin [Bicyclus anynana]|uniref:Connectin n=1 Tax=Bicyclus anynana TaxID=110368 RepID=A0ABM3LSF6_BICAN|nr:connectin [Bicyclus anynana]XP_052742009.1 connectin [Bicyclus anynana]
MEQFLQRMMYVCIVISLVNQMSIAVQARDNSKRRTKEKSGGFQKNICDITDRDSKVHCYCENTREPRNATKAECWVFNGGIPRDDLIWQSFATQPALQSLSFNVRVDGALGYVPTKALQYLQRLKSINIKYGNIVDISTYAFANLTNLKEASLSQNQIETLQQYAFAHLPNLTVVNLEENMILEIGRDSFYDVPKLQKLVLSKNNISSISNGAFQHAFNLLELELNKNNIFHLNRHTFDGLANLRRLDLRKNRVYNLTEFTFAELWNLQELLLGKNDLKYISERAFDGLSQLRKLSLDDNKLGSLPSGLFEGVRGLSSLDLRSNELHALTFDNIKPILDNLKPSGSNLLLEENNFVCDCRLKWMHSLRNETKSQNTKDSLEGVTCKMDPPIVSSAYNKIPEETSNANQDNHYNENAVDIFTKTNSTDKKVDEYNALSDTSAKKGVKRNVLKIAPETLPCPVDTKKTTELPHYIIDPVIPIQNEMKTFRYQEMNAANKRPSITSLVLWSFSFVFFFT